MLNISPINYSIPLNYSSKNNSTNLQNHTSNVAMKGLDAKANIGRVLVKPLDEKTILENFTADALKYFKKHSDTPQEAINKERIFGQHMKENKKTAIELLSAKDENGEKILSHKDVANIMLRGDEFPLYDTEKILSAVETAKQQGYTNNSLGAWSILKYDS